VERAKYQYIFLLDNCFYFVIYKVLTAALIVNAVQIGFAAVGAIATIDVTDA
jgi:hypothetical protein